MVVVYFVRLRTQYLAPRDLGKYTTRSLPPPPTPPLSPPRSFYSPLCRRGLFPPSTEECLASNCRNAAPNSPLTSFFFPAFREVFLSFSGGKPCRFSLPPIFFFEKPWRPLSLASGRYATDFGRPRPKAFCPPTITSLFDFGLPFESLP